ARPRVLGGGPVARERVSAMTEAEWHGCVDPHALLRFLQKQTARSAPRRRLRLYLCGCCRLAWELAPPPDPYLVVDVVEAFADGLASLDQVNRVRQALLDEPRRWVSAPPGLPYAIARLAASGNQRLWDAVHQVTALLVGLRINGTLGRDPWQHPPNDWQEVKAKWNALRPGEYLRHTELVRCVFGDPFRAVKSDPDWMTRTV